MIGSVFNGMSGLLAFSQGLNVISSNVSNMNTPGYKSSELQFLDVFYRERYSAIQNGNTSLSQYGSGVDTGNTVVRFSEGEIRSTGQDLDVAIDGNGFLVLNRDGEYLYTRAGQLYFNDEGYLASRSGDARVMGLENGRLVDIRQQEFSSISHSPTTEISFSGILSTGTENNDGDPIHEIQDITVVDAIGEERTLRAEFELVNINDLEWEIRLYEETNLLTTDSVRFQPSGQPRDGNNSFAFDLEAEDGSITQVSITMGEPNDPTSATSSSFGTSSTARVNESDGYSTGFLVSSELNQIGTLVLTYSNGEEREHGQLAMASFLRLQDLTQSGNGVFSAGPGEQPVIGHANDGTMGSLVPGAVELSNVDLTQQFGDLIIVQRGYQASSQILTVSNEMLQQLIEMRGR